jgi:AraC-like DNA-binding protein
MRYGTAPREGINGPTVAAVLAPAERARVDAAGTGCFAVVHRDSVGDAISTVRERPVDAILLSVHECRPEHVENVAFLIRDFPSVPTVALVSHHDPRVPEMLLQLGASGVRQAIDVTAPAGWARLRELMLQPVTRSAARIQGPVLEALACATPDARLFFEAMIRLSPDLVTVRDLARRLSVRPSTLMSRFIRIGLPSPKSYLASVRLLHAAQLFDDRGLSIADVAHRLDYSSPQSFGRHVRSLLGITSTEFRTRFPFDAAVARFIAVMIEPYHDSWARFHPLARSSRVQGVPA